MACDGDFSLLIIHFSRVATKFKTFIFFTFQLFYCNLQFS